MFFLIDFKVLHSDVIQYPRKNAKQHYAHMIAKTLEFTSRHASVI